MADIEDQLRQLEGQYSDSDQDSQGHSQEQGFESQEEDEELEEEEKRTRFLQRVLLDYLAVNGGEVSVLFIQQLSRPQYLLVYMLAM